MRRKNSSFLVCFDPFSLESTLGSLLSCFKRQEQEKREDQNLALRQMQCFKAFVILEIRTVDAVAFGKFHGS